MKRHPCAALWLVGVVSWSGLLAGCDHADQAAAEPPSPAAAETRVPSAPGLPAPVPPTSSPVVFAARWQVGKTTVYDPAYVRLDYPGGDLPIEKGVCSDVVVRAFRRALGSDLQQLVHEDMTAAFSQYPQAWGLRKPDANIDHRRVPNLQRYFDRQGFALAVTKAKGDYLDPVQKGFDPRCSGI